MSSFENIEKLIQMATIEQMFSMLQKMRNESISHNVVSNGSVTSNIPFVSNVPVVSSNNDEIVHRHDNIIMNHDKIINNHTEIISDTQNDMELVCQRIVEITSSMNSMFDAFTRTTDVKISDLNADMRQSLNLMETDVNNTFNLQKTSISKLSKDMALVMSKLAELEEKVEDIRKHSNKNHEYLCNQIRGQQLLTSYPGFSSGKYSSDTHAEAAQEQETSVAQETHPVESYEDDDINPLMITCSNLVVNNVVELIIKENEQEETKSEQEETKDEQEETKDEQGEVGTNDEPEKTEVEIEADVEQEEVESEPEAEEVESEEVEVEVEEAEVIVEEVKPEETKKEPEILSDDDKSEPEVETEEEEEEEIEIEIEVEAKVETKVEAKVETKVEEEANEEEEGEEVFELEIDGVTYYATDEENGPLYEVKEDGDIGDQVGVLKDGEPIFN